MEFKLFYNPEVQNDIQSAVDWLDISVMLTPYRF